MSCHVPNSQQIKKLVYKTTDSGRSSAMNFAHFMRNPRFDLTRRRC